MSIDFALTHGEKHSPLWRRLLEQLQRDLAQLRERNDSVLLDPVATAELRGRIAQLKELIALEDPTPGVDP